MKNIVLFAVFLMALPAAAGSPKSAADLEKEKAMANPYPNDYGPDNLAFLYRPCGTGFFDVRHNHITNCG